MCTVCCIAKPLGALSTTTARADHICRSSNAPATAIPPSNARNFISAPLCGFGVRPQQSAPAIWRVHRRTNGLGVRRTDAMFQFYTRGARAFCHEQHFDLAVDALVDLELAVQMPR